MVIVFVLRGKEEIKRKKAKLSIHFFFNIFKNCLNLFHSLFIINNLSFII